MLYYHLHGLLSGILYNSILNGLSNISDYNNCTIIVSSVFMSYLNKISLINSTLQPCESFNDRYMISFNNSHLDNCYFENCYFKGKCSLSNHNGFYSGKFINCIFEDVNIFPNVLSNSDDLILFDNCTINYSKNNLIYYYPFAYSKGTFTQIKFINCSIVNKDNNFKSLIYAYAKPNGYCEFINCKIYIPENLLVIDGYSTNIEYITNYICTFNNTLIHNSIILISDSLKNSTGIKVLII